MAIYDKSQGALKSNNNSLYEVVMLADGFGNPTNPSGSSATNIGGTSVFGETAVAETTPVFQLDGLYGIDDENEFQKNDAFGGSQTVDDNGLLTVNSGTNANGFSALRSKRSIRYRPGQGSMLRFTAMFPNGHVAGCQQVAGYLNQTDLLAIGYNAGANAEFAIVRRYRSTAELFEIDIQTGGTSNVDITLNDVAYPSIAVSGSAQDVATIIGNTDFPGWIVDYSGTKVWFLYSGPPIDLDGVFSFSGGAVTANTTTLQNGQLPNDTWIYQSDWNLDTLDGTGPSGMILDPGSLNVYQIDFRWLGVGIIRYSIEDQATGNMIPFHVEHYTNLNDRPHISNPSMRAGYAVVNLGNTTDVSVKGGSMMGAIQGKIIRNVSPRSSFNDINNLTSGNTHHVLSIKNDRVNINGTLSKLNQREIIIDLMACGVLANAGNNATFYFYKNAELDSGTQFTYDSVTGGISESKTTGKYSPGTGTLISTFVVASNATANIDLTSLRMILAPLERLSIFVKCPAQVSPSVGLTYTVE